MLQETSEEKNHKMKIDSQKFYSNNDSNELFQQNSSYDTKNSIKEEDDEFQDAIFEEETLLIFEKKKLEESLEVVPRQRRIQIPQRPNNNINCIELLKNCVGKSIDDIPIPFNYREPISMLQRLVEEIEYTDLLDKASQCSNQWEQMAYVAAFSVSCYCTTPRTYKPFSSLLGETYEYDCSRDSSEDVIGWKAIAEQVSLVPPKIALNVESTKHDWHLFHEFSMTSKFRLNFLQVIPTCTTHLVFKNSRNHYTWNKVNTFVRNLVVGKLWVENIGDLDIVNHTTKDVCHLKYSPSNFFSTKSANKVNGMITDSNNFVKYIINGTWTDQIEAAVVLEPEELYQQSTFKTGPPKVLWKKKEISYAFIYFIIDRILFLMLFVFQKRLAIQNMYNFTDFTVKLNEPENNVAPTDSRKRPDQRLMENALWDEAYKENSRLEDKQRTRVKNQKPFEPVWFEKIIEPFTNQSIYVLKKESYWIHKNRKDWSVCPNIF